MGRAHTAPSCRRPGRDERAAYIRGGRPSQFMATYVSGAWANEVDVSIFAHALDVAEILAKTSRKPTVGVLTRGLFFW